MSKSNSRELLPTSVRPTHYRVWLMPSLTTFTFDGEVDVTLDVKTSTSVIVLHANDMDIKSARVTQAGVSQDLAQPAHPAPSGQENAVELSFAKALTAGTPAQLHVTFTGKLNDLMAGFYRSKYRVGTEERWMATTQFEPTDARRAFPCWDEPLLKATFDIEIAVREDRPMTILSNMPPKSDEVVDGVRIVKFEKTPIVSTYLLAWVVSELDYVEAHTEKKNIRVRVYTAPGKKDQGRFALSMATRTLDFFSEYYGIDYALPKADMVAIPDFAAGAMENWGLITYREVALLIDEQRSPVSSKQRVAYVVAHELAHQWFGNLVTMEWWKELWLNEGYATYVGNQALDHFYPQWQVFTQFVSQYIGGALSLDALESSHPIEVEVNSSAQVNEIFDAISYNKGASVIRMCLDFVGEEAFQRGMQLYLRKHKYANAVTTDLWAALSEACGRDIAAFMQNWTQKTGYPVVSVSLSDDGATLRVAQTRFLESGRTLEDSPVWELALNLLTATSATPRKVHISSASAKAEVALAPSERLSAPSSFLLVNANSFGFFRTQYSPQLLAALATALSAGHLAPIDRLSLQSDIFALSRAGHSPTAAALGLASAYAPSEDDYTVWSDLLLSAKQVVSMFSDCPGLGDALRPWLGRLVAPALTRVGWDAKEGEDDMQGLLRGVLTSAALAARDPAAVAQGMYRFWAHVSGKSKLVGDMQGVVFRAAGAAGGSSAFDALLGIYRTADMQEERVRVLVGLGSAQEPELLRRALELALSDEVRSQDTVYVISAVSGTRAKGILWDFVREQWPAFEKRFKEGQFLLARIVQSAISGFTTEARAKEVEEFFAKNPTPSAERTIRQGLEKIRSQAAWIARDAEGVREFLKNEAAKQ